MQKKANIKHFYEKIDCDVNFKLLFFNLANTIKNVIPTIKNHLHEKIFCENISNQKNKISKQIIFGSGVMIFLLHCNPGDFVFLLIKKIV